MKSATPKVGGVRFKLWLLWTFGAGASCGAGAAVWRVLATRRRQGREEGTTNETDEKDSSSGAQVKRASELLEIANQKLEDNTVWKRLKEKVDLNLSDADYPVSSDYLLKLHEQSAREATFNPHTVACFRSAAGIFRILAQKKIAWGLKFTDQRPFNAKLFRLFRAFDANIRGKSGFRLSRIFRNWKTSVTRFSATAGVSPRAFVMPEKQQGAVGEIISVSARMRRLRADGLVEYIAKGAHFFTVVHTYGSDEFFILQSYAGTSMRYSLLNFLTGKFALDQKWVGVTKFSNDPGIGEAIDVPATEQWLRHYEYRNSGRYQLRPAASSRSQIKLFFCALADVFNAFRSTDDSEVRASEVDSAWLKLFGAPGRGTALWAWKKEGWRMEFGVHRGEMV